MVVTSGYDSSPLSRAEADDASEAGSWDFLEDNDEEYDVPPSSPTENSDASSWDLLDHNEAYTPSSLSPVGDTSDATSCNSLEDSEAYWLNLRWALYSWISFTISDSQILADEQAQDLFAEDFSNESRMNAAGRTTMHPFRDVRSAAFACRRGTRRYGNTTPRVRGVANRKWEKAERRRGNKRAKREIVRWAVYASQE